jgi:transcriptional regulator with XRE-family HTH domain
LVVRKAYVKKKNKANKSLPDLDLRLGVAIKRMRQNKGMTQCELAENAQVTQACISLLENGQRYGNNTRVNLKILQRISLTLGRKLSSLIRLAEDSRGPEDAIAELEAYIKKKQS